ncbi:MAG: hypothetical protein V2I67_20495 [Thermoanaerobaculales bacterium]|jgi:hypothetical protein|nr:hypothetical protein [Thermoanaerobaculales bacterium]
MHSHVATTWVVETAHSASWQADASAQAAAGTAGAGAKSGFVNGIAIYQLTDKGLLASADIAGTKYWKNKKLNS